ncbi:GNAT family N-acetyltransferase [Aestuariibacter sp. AA17]|uniref:GNAT family N-acetyltransferase n=1 Tax=Fluctibacter corallii TaxID=2984329 RepID=A0ABT3AB48_9ALTE|nr:GNAT family N-acetyltransferase [Aestuariibacter sp. AA17]MCV2885834.1 GNAT family N-acetyltransferase [Aestuariibacter sp. AA17]
MIRQASPDDVPQLATLVKMSGKASLTGVLDISPSLCASQFLLFAVAQDNGHFSYRQHIVISPEPSDPQRAIQGCAAYWPRLNNAQMREATIRTFIHFYGELHVKSVLLKAQYLDKVICLPEPENLPVGHIAIEESARRSGKGTALLNALKAKAIELNRRGLELDVECHNLPAITLYERFGFAITGQHFPCEGGKKIGLMPHFHMKLSL